MPETDISGAATVSKRSLSRRTVLTAAAWSVPAIAIANATPAFAAASGCEPIVITDEWHSVPVGELTDSAVDTSTAGPYVQFGVDSRSYGTPNAQNGTDALYALSHSIPTIPGYWYSLNLKIATQGGYVWGLHSTPEGPCPTVNTDIVAFVRDYDADGNSTDGLQILHGFQSQENPGSRSGVTVFGQPLASVPYATTGFAVRKPETFWDGWHCPGMYGFGIPSTNPSDLVQQDVDTVPETHDFSLTFQATSALSQIGLEFIPFLTASRENNDDYRVYLAVECVGPTPPTP